MKEKFSKSHDKDIEHAFDLFEVLKETLSQCQDSFPNMQNPTSEMDESFENVQHASFFGVP